MNARAKLLEPSTEFEDAHGHEDETRTRTSTSGEDEHEHEYEGATVGAEGTKRTRSRGTSVHRPRDRLAALGGGRQRRGLFIEKRCVFAGIGRSGGAPPGRDALGPRGLDRLAEARHDERTASSGGSAAMGMGTG
jgi:hypothetical protein